MLVTETGTGCFRNDTIRVRVTSKPKPQITPGSQTICGGTQIYLHVVDTGAYAMSGYPVGTIVDWLGIANGLTPNDSIGTLSGPDSVFIARVTLMDVETPPR